MNKGKKQHRRLSSEAELDLAKRELKDLEDRLHYKNRCYTVTNLPEDVIRMEIGQPTKEVLDIAVRHALKVISSLYSALSSLFMFFALFHVRHHKFKNNCHYGYEAVQA